MIRLRLLVASMLVVSCARTPVAAVGAVGDESRPAASASAQASAVASAPSPSASVSAALVLSAAPAVSSSSPLIVPPPASSAGLITDEECVAHGGRVFTEHDYEEDFDRRGPGHVVTPFRVCRYPSPSRGKSCDDEADCVMARCRCVAPLDGPNASTRPDLKAKDGMAMHGVCSDGHLSPGVWWCLVVGGHAHVHGIIID